MTTEADEADFAHWYEAALRAAKRRTTGSDGA